MVSFAVDSFADIDIFPKVQYKQYLDQLEKQLRESPGDAAVRLKLGVTYIKLGYYAEATKELAKAAVRPELRSEALCHSLVANVRAANFRQAVKDGVASLTEKPSNDRARFWTWLAAQQLGGYPHEVPQNLRMEVKAGRHPSRVQFEEVASQIGLDKTSGGRGSAIFDMDGDGYLDVIIACTMASCGVYRNNGDGTFRDASVGSGLEDCINTHAIIAGDYNNDGWDDIYLTRLGFYAGESVLYRNNGDGTFTDVSREAGIDGVCFGSVSVWCDHDNDGWLDLVQFIWSPEKHVLHTLIHGKGPDRGHPMRIYHNNRNGTFTEVGRELGIDGCWATMSGNLGDFDNDGHIDILLGNGSPTMSRTEPPVILENDGQGKFHNVSFTAGLPFSGKGHGANLADLAGDGRLCLLVAAGGSYPADLLTTSVLRPKTLPGNYLNVRLRGTKSNRSAIGARLILTAGGRTQHRLMTGGTGFGSLPFEEHFGLGKLNRVESLEIRWPSGLQQQIRNLPINNTIRITEGESGWQEVYPQKAKSKPIAEPLGDKFVESIL